MSDGNEKLIKPLRVVLGGVGVFGIGLLIVAGTLKPSPLGYGTHQRLGLPPCGILSVYGRPCPSCGMTTSWSHLVRGQIQHSLNANPAGTWLGIWVATLSVWILISSITGRWFLCRPNQWYLLGLAISVLLLTLLVWVIRFFF